MSDLAITIESDPSGAFVRLRVRGKLTVAEADRAQSEATRDHPGKNRLWDFREAELSGWSVDDMRTFIKGVGARTVALEKTRVGALVGREVDFGIARMFEMLAEGTLPMEGAVFRDEEQAIRWISARA